MNIMASRKISKQIELMEAIVATFKNEVTG
jgi:hypothetical protein